jgi:hypothetical protein
LAVNLCWSALLVVGLLLAGGKTQKIFSSFEVQSPGISQIASSTPFLLTVPVLAVLAIVKELSIRNVRLKVWTNLVHTFVILAIQAIATVGFFLPLFHLLDRLSSIPGESLSNVAWLCDLGSERARACDMGL